MAMDHIPKVPSLNVCSVNMSQACKVCGEPAAGFHFGAFTCEGCKSFFGRTYNNLSSLNECKSNGRCVINKKTRTSCKSCRLRKCLMVGMSKSGSRYGRRSNWFKIHYLMQSSSNNSNSNIPIEEAVARISTNPSITTGSTTIVDSWDESPIPAAIRVPTSEDLKCLQRLPAASDSDINLNIKRQQEQKLVEGIRLGNVHLPFNIEVKELPSPTSSSADSHSSDSPKESGENSLFPGGAYSEAFYPKDLLSFYNIPSIGARIPPYLTSPVLAQRFLYPYYPNIFSLYTRRQYLDNLIKETNNSEASGQSKSISFSDDEESRDTPHDYQPPLKMIKSNSSPPALYPMNPIENRQKQWLSRQDTPSNCSPCSSPRKTPPPTTHSPIVRKISDLNDQKCLHQEAPIDLSVRGKGTEEKSNTPSEKPSSQEQNNPSTAHKESESLQLNQEDKISKDDQRNPLDLSGFKT